MERYKNFSFVLGLMFALLALGEPVLAQIGGEGFDGIIPTAKETGDLGWRIQNGKVSLNDIPLVLIGLIDLLSKLAGGLAVIMLIYAGFQFMLGDLAGTKEAAKTTIQYALSGLAVAFLAWVIVNLLQTLLTT